MINVGSAHSSVFLHHVKHCSFSSFVPLTLKRKPDEPNLQLPISVNKSSEQVEREIIYQTLLAMKMDINEIKNMLFRLGGNYNVNQLPSYTPTNQEFEPVHHDNDVITVSEQADNLSMVDMEKEMIRKALDKFSGNRRKAAQALNISERTLYRKIKEYDI